LHLQAAKKNGVLRVTSPLLGGLESHPCTK
jgi:hypothetical protein